MLRIDRAFVRRCAAEYQRRYDTQYGSYREDEEDLRAWLDSRPSPKNLDKKHFVQLCMWKSPRPRRRYESNDEALIKEASQIAFTASSPRLKLHALRALNGVSVAVAATILHYFHPDAYPIFDVRARTTLKEAGLWKRATGDASVAAWEEYIETMYALSGRLGVSLRELDKALYAYDRGWGRGESRRR